MIPFIKTTEFDWKIFGKHMANCNGIYTNKGPNERALCALLEQIIGFPVATCANATIALTQLQRSLGAFKWVRPSFTFPATNLGVSDFENTYLEPDFSGPTLGRCAQVSKKQAGLAQAQIITIPFGNLTPNLVKQCEIPTIVDAAACASPSMHIAREWLANGAFAVVISLHATKIWPAGGEGAFVAFNNKQDRDEFEKSVAFGIVIDAEGNRHCEDVNATNGKLSEFGAAGAFASWENFGKEYARREETEREMVRLCEEFNIQHIASRQTFWIAPRRPWQVTQSAFASMGVESRNYYWDTAVTPHSELCKRGLCLPMHNPEIVEIFKHIGGRL
jgi:hypothetical protein